MVIWFAAFVPAVINTFAGVRTIERPIIEAAHMLGTPRWRFVTEVLMPAAAPMIFTGLRLSLQAAGPRWSRPNWSARSSASASSSTWRSRTSIPA